MSTIPSVLKTRFAHSRDSNIRFYIQGHKYDILNDKKSKYTSVTTWTKSHFPKFDEDKAVQSIFNSKKWGPDNKYWGMTAEEIKASWKVKGQTAANSGTKLHDRIEHFMNDKRFTFAYTQKELYEIYMADNKNKLDDQVEWNYFMNFVKDHPHLKPYRTEWLVYDEDLKMAGAIDMVYENPDGTLSIYDWKRATDIPKVHNWGQVATNPLISHLHDTNFWHYAVQLNTYRAILERKYEKKVTSLCLVRLHPDTPEENYELLDVPLLDDEMDKLIKERLESV